MEKSAKKRPSFFGVFIGTNRTGKSSTARLYAEAWKKNNPGRKVMAFDPQQSFKGLADIEIMADQENWDEVICTLRNGLLILDDFRILQESGTPASGLRKLLAYRAKWNVDIIMVCHSPALVLLFMTAFITHYYIFRCQTTKNSFSSRIPNADMCIKASDIINAYVKEYGAGSYPKFPHIIVTNQSDSLFPQNVKPKELQLVIKALGY